MIKERARNQSVNKETPIFMGHGDIDPVVQYSWGQMTSQTLKEAGCTVDFRTYKGLTHSADPQEMDDLETFLREQLPATS